MPDTKKELIHMLNSALALEHAARIQYLAHAELIKGLNAEKIIERLKDNASDEEKHEDKFRNLIGAYLNGEPTMGTGQVLRATKTEEILEVNLKKEREAVDLYKEIYKKIEAGREKLQYEFEALEHEVRHIIVEEEQHIAELSILLVR